MSQHILKKLLCQQVQTGALMAFSLIAIDHAHGMGAAVPLPPSPTPTLNPDPAPTSSLPPPVENVDPPAFSRASVVGEITKIATQSSCARYPWANRGRAPAAYLNGMALAFAKSMCRLRAGETKAILMADKNKQNTSKDALAWYESAFDQRGMGIDVSGLETLRSLYTLGIGLGMRESSGKYCEGWDTTATSMSAVEAEAGTFQFSYNSMGASNELRTLYNEYRSGKHSCNLDVFSKNVSCKAQGIVGTGAGADFQRFVKSCPAFGAEYAMITLRVLRKHYGPINRKEAELNGACDQMLETVEDFVASKAALVCSKL